MSAVQAFIYDRLAGDAALASLVGTAIYDTPPSDSPPDISVLIGAEEVLDASDKTGSAQIHRAEIEIVARTSGFAAAKDVAAAVRSSLEGASGAAGNGMISRVQFRRAQSLRDTTDGLRRVRMRFDIFYDEF